MDRGPAVHQIVPMTLAHLHLLVNHAPLFAAAFAVPILTWSLFRTDRGAWNAGVFLLVAGAVGAGLAQWSGEGAEEAVEHLPGVLESAIGEHEERAEVALVVAILSALVAVVGRIFGEKRHHLAIGITALFATAAFGAVAYAAKAGGEIRHAEEINGSPRGTATPSLGFERQAEGDEDDDEGNASRK